MTALVGAHLADSAADDAGAAYVFRASGAAWVQEAKLVASDAEEDDYFGFSVDISETTALVGAYSYDDAFESHSYNVGAAYVFELSNGRWNQQARLNAPYLSVHEWFGIRWLWPTTVLLLVRHGPQQQGKVLDPRIYSSDWVKSGRSASRYCRPIARTTTGLALPLR